MTEFDQERTLFSGGRNNSLIENSTGNQSRAKRPLIIEEDDDDSLSESEGPRILKHGHPEIPQYRPPAPSSAIRKDSFASYFNPANWFKWGKERKLARQAAKAINDPSGNAGTSLGAKHWAALNTTHGQRILKKQAKASAKSDATGWNSKIEAFTKNQFANRQWEKFGQQAIGSKSAWAHAKDIRHLIDKSLPMPDGVRFDERYGNLYPQGDGFGPDSAHPMKPGELQLAKEEAKEDAQFERQERRDARKAAKGSASAPFKSSGSMFDDIQTLDPEPKPETDDNQKIVAPPHDSLVDDDDDDDQDYKPSAADYQNLDEADQNKKLAKLMGW